MSPCHSPSLVLASKLQEKESRERKDIDGSVRCPEEDTPVEDHADRHSRCQRDSNLPDLSRGSARDRDRRASHARLRGCTHTHGRRKREREARMGHSHGHRRKSRGRFPFGVESQVTHARTQGGQWKRKVSLSLLRTVLASLAGAKGEPPQRRRLRESERTAAAGTDATRGEREQD